jgi:ketosteroid isomerase-like protein
LYALRIGVSSRSHAGNSGKVPGVPKTGGNAMKPSLIALALVALCTTTGCQEQNAVAAVPSDADPTAAADKTQKAWASMDLKQILALYANDIVGFDPVEPALSSSWANWDRLNQAFVKMKFDALTVSDRKIQILDANTFVASGTGHMTSKDGPMKTADVRFTDVYEKQEDGSWLIVNEHVSMVPPMPKA